MCKMTDEWSVGFFVVKMLIFYCSSGYRRAFIKLFRFFGIFFQLRSETEVQTPFFLNFLD